MKQKQIIFLSYMAFWICLGNVAFIISGNVNSNVTTELYSPDGGCQFLLAPIPTSVLYPGTEPSINYFFNSRTASKPYPGTNMTELQVRLEC
jgi:hypothetical protein